MSHRRSTCTPARHATSPHSLTAFSTTARLKPESNRVFTEATLSQKPFPLTQSMALVTRRFWLQEGTVRLVLPPKRRSDDGALHQEGYAERLPAYTHLHDAVPL